jgi:hypothetical protein
LAALAALPEGALIAPLDLGAYAIGATRLQVVGAPYHRNNAGNLAVYHFFLGAPDQAAIIAQAWDVRYVALCDDSFATASRGSVAYSLRHGAPPRWLQRIPMREGVPALYRVRADLFPGHAAR